MGAVQWRIMQSSDPPGSVVSFGNYRLLVHQRLLLRAGVAIDVGDRAFDVLVALVQRAGQTISKRELILKAWSGGDVGENALQAQITALRRSFGLDRDLIVTVSGRGYQFAGGVSSDPPTRESYSLPATVPEPTLELVGRERELEQLVNLVGTHRLVTIFGPGGVGKSLLARELARVLISEFGGGVQWIDLSAIDSPQAARAAVFEVIGETDATSLRAARAFSSAVEAPARLLFLDGCERWIGLAAELTDATLRLGRASRVLATSREPLRVEGESTYRLGPLELPDTEFCSAEAVSKTPAVRLLLARLAASGGAVLSSDASVGAARAICLALDGLPLAIEMAAVRAAGVGFDWVVAHLDQPMPWLAHGSRTAPKRQRSMQASLDWSFEALSAPERWALKRVSEFREPFSLIDVCALLAPDGIDAADALDRLSSLVAKSLVDRLTSNGSVSYRLLWVTRCSVQAMPWPRA
jgi:predicted ATPase/DNA-binding winged helix-turn-helix (wHTH) protein